MNRETLVYTVLGWISLEQCRKISRLIMLYKILHNVATIPNHCIPIIRVQEVIHRDFNNCKPTLTFTCTPFFHQLLKIMWNSLPATVIEATSVEEFKKRVLNSFCNN